MEPQQLSATLEGQFRRQPSAYTAVTTESDRKFMAFMLSASGAGRDDRVLDVACGAGAVTMAFAERCRGAVGLDFHVSALARAREAAIRRGLINAEFVVSEIERMALDDAGFSGAVCRFSFHHFVNPERVFAEMARVVGAHGWMVISDMTASEDRAKAARHNELERLCDPTHARTLPASAFERMFSQHRFRISMKIARDSRLTLDDWIRFSSPEPQSAVRLRRLMEASIEGDLAGLKLARDGGTIRTTRTSVTYVIERE